jgi:hypothetical protein
MNKSNISVLFSEIRLVLNIFLIFSIIQVFKENNFDFMDIGRSFVYGTVISVIFAIISSLNKNSVLLYRLTFINGDPNYSAVCLAVSIAIIQYEMSNLKYRFKELILIFFLFSAGLFTLSRGFIIMIIPIILSIIIGVFPLKHKNFTGKIFLSIPIILIMVLIFKEKIIDLFQSYLYRFTDNEYRGGSGRIGIWQTYLQYIFSDINTILLGIGTETNSSGLFNGRSIAFHNLYLEILGSKGMVGSFSLLIIILLFLYETKKIWVFKTYVPLLTSAFGFLFLSGLYSDISIMTISLSFFISLKAKRKKIRI